MPFQRVHLPVRELKEMTRAAKVLNSTSYLLRAMVVAVYCKMMKPLLVSCIENGPSLLPMIKTGEEIYSIMEWSHWSHF